MKLYAEGTECSVETSQTEIRRILKNYKTANAVIGEVNGKAAVVFEMNNRRIRFVATMPIKGSRHPRSKFVMSDAQLRNETMRLWRCLVISIKSKLEAVQSGISTFENEFLSFIVLPSGETVGEYVTPQIEGAYTSGKMPALLGYTE